MNREAARDRVLNPLERFSEIVFGLIMVLSFTCAFSVAEAGREDVRAMFIGAIGCNLAWGIIDAAFYLIGCLTEHGRLASILRSVQHCPEPVRAQQIIADAMPAAVADALHPADFERIHTHLKQLPPPAPHPGLTGENWRGALGVFLLVFVSTFPVVVPFIFLRDARLALHLSNAIAIALLFATGHMLAGYAGLRRTVTGLAMVAIGAALVALTIALGG
ncbi:MAG: VIT1/CCC1 transporter family protein [Chthoniobacteraceae bacterium]